MSDLGSGDLVELARRRASTPGANEKVLLYLESLPRQSEYAPTTAAPSMFGDPTSRRVTRNFASNHFNDNEPNEGQEEEEWAPQEVEVDGEQTSSLSYGEVRNGGEANWLGGGYTRGEQWGAQQSPRLNANGDGNNTAHGQVHSHYESYESSFGNMGPLPVFNGHSSPPRNVWPPPQQVEDIVEEEDGDDVQTITQGDVEVEPVPEPGLKPRTNKPNGNGSGYGNGLVRHDSDKTRSSLSRTSKKSLPKSTSLLNTVREPATETNKENARTKAPRERPKPRRRERDPQASGVLSPPPTSELNDTEAQMVSELIASRRASTALTDGAGHFHDSDLCILLHAADDPTTHAVVRRALRKAIRQRVKQLDVQQPRKGSSGSAKTPPEGKAQVKGRIEEKKSAKSAEEVDTMPQWAKALVAGIHRANERFDGLDQKLDQLGPSMAAAVAAATLRNQSHHQYPYHSRSRSYTEQSHTRTRSRSRFTAEPDDDAATQTVAINTAHPTGAGYADSAMGGMGIYSLGGIGYGNDDDMFTHALPTDGETRLSRGGMTDLLERDDSPGQQYLEAELYKLRQRHGGSQTEAAATHKSWELGAATEDVGAFTEMGAFTEAGAFTETGLPEIPDGMTDVYGARIEGRGSPRDSGRESASIASDQQEASFMSERRDMDLPPIPEEEQEAASNGLVWVGGSQVTASELDPTPPWQRIHQRILTWAMIWPVTEIARALESTTRGNQVNDIALSVWSMQCYKRYVRSRITDTPRGRPDRLFVPPNMADAISTAVFNGLHEDACGMLKDLWAPFGLQGAPKMILVLAKHRTDLNHWVVHKFSFAEGSLTTYDTFPERSLPDGRPLGWWFAIRAAWPDVVHEEAATLTQKVFRLHRPMQLGIDNSVAAGGIWRNLLMGSRAERSLDLERLRDLIHTEVKNLRQRKLQGKLSLSLNTRAER